MAAETRGPVGQVMVVGAGIAGVQAALDLANSGFYVHLVEKKSAIGGVMAQLDKTFPTNDCSMCIISPKLVECGRHLNIEIHTLSEVKAISGEPGNFKVTVEKEPRYIDPSQMHRLRRLRRGLPGAGARRVQPGAGGRQGDLPALSPGHSRHLRHQESRPGPVRPGLPGQSQRPGLRAAHQGAQVSRGPGPDHGPAAPAGDHRPDLPPPLRDRLPPPGSG